jgi:FAD:protein FMN transferase
MRKIEFYAMGSQMSALLETYSLAGEEALEQVPAWFEEWEQALSRFRPDSELSVLNDSPGFPVPVSETLWGALQAARKAHQRSQGVVTPTILSALERAGYDRSFEQIGEGPAPGSGRALPSAQSLDQVAFDPVKRTVLLPVGVHLDLGGIGKGWAAQRAMQRLSAFGPALVDASGDLAISAPLIEGQPWQVGVSDPFDSERDLAMLGLGRCGVATSGRDVHRWFKDGAWQHHIINPRTGRPAETGIISATVLAPDALQSEMAAKMVLILGSREGLRWLEEQPEMEGLFVLENHETVETSGFDAYRWRE